MANISGQMDELFDDGLDFDVIFDNEDSLIDTVAGVKEDGTPILGDEFEGLDEDFNLVGESDVSIPGEPTTDDGKKEDTAGKADLLARTTDTKNDVQDQKLNRDAESDGTPAAPNSAEAQVDDTESPAEFRKDLGYTKEAAEDVSVPDEPSTDDGKNDESANNAAAKTTMANGQNQQKPDDNTSVKEEADIDAELFDESFLAPTMDDEMLDESFLAEDAKEAVEESNEELYDESFLDSNENEPVAEAADDVEDGEEDLIDAVEDNQASGPDLDYQVGEDDLLIDDLLN